jgi:hypothetical protein
MSKKLEKREEQTFREAKIRISHIQKHFYGLKE